MSEEVTQGIPEQPDIRLDGRKLADVLLPHLTSTPAQKPPTLATQLISTVDSDKRIARIERLQSVILVAVWTGAIAFVLIAGMFGFLIGRLY